MGLFGSDRKKPKSVKAQINKVKRQLEKKKDKELLASLKKKLRGY